MPAPPLLVATLVLFTSLLSACISVRAPHTVTQQFESLARSYRHVAIMAERLADRSRERPTPEAVEESCAPVRDVQVRLTLEEAPAGALASAWEALRAAQLALHFACGELALVARESLAGANETVVANRRAMIAAERDRACEALRSAATHLHRAEFRC